MKIEHCVIVVLVQAVLSSTVVWAGTSVLDTVKQNAAKHGQPTARHGAVAATTAKNAATPPEKQTLTKRIPATVRPKASGSHSTPSRSAGFARSRGTPATPTVGTAVTHSVPAVPPAVGAASGAGATGPIAGLPTAQRRAVNTVHPTPNAPLAVMARRPNTVSGMPGNAQLSRHMPINAVLGGPATFDAKKLVRR
jgi:hypothetical protein